VVISGLPWMLFAPDRQRRIVDAIAATLAPDGAFSCTSAAVRSPQASHSSASSA